MLLGADAYTALAETSDHGYPVLEHVKRLVNDKSSGRPPLPARLCSPRVAATSICTSARMSPSAILSHTDTAVRLYLQETFTFLLLTAEAAVALAPPAKAQTT